MADGLPAREPVEPLPRVVKHPDWAVTPNLVDYDAEAAAFSWETARQFVDGLPGGEGLNIAHEAVDRHAARARPHRIALRFLRRDGGVTDLTYRDLCAATSRFANALASIGIEAGDRVFTLLGRVPEQHIAALGTLKHRATFCPLFSAFGPEPIEQRLRLGNARVLVTSASLYEKRVASWCASMTQLDHVLLIDVDDDRACPPGTRSLPMLVSAASDSYQIGPTSPASMALLHFTSGTTGTPKGAVHVHGAVVAHMATARYALDLHPDDIFWCTADPGWVTGTSYGIIAPLALGVTSIVDEGDFDADRWYGILQDQHVTVWYTAPTAIRMLMRIGAEVAAGYDLSRLRFVASVGEPLNPEAVVWGDKAFGRPIHDNWWQTETGGVMIANFAATDIRPGSMGRPLPGITATILARDEEGELSFDHDGNPIVVNDPAQEGELALRTGWPSMFRAYLHEPERYDRCFAGRWYRTGDLARRDADGYYWFVARGDDVIKTAGHLIGPFEVESALMEHPAVVEAGVIGVPDPVAGQRIKAFVVLARDLVPSEKLRRELLGFGRSRLGPAVAPREIAFTEALPHTRSGKTMRRLLRARELGLAEGDTSTLEST